MCVEKTDDEESVSKKCARKAGCNIPTGDGSALGIKSPVLLQSALALHDGVRQLRSRLYIPVLVRASAKQDHVQGVSSLNGSR